MYVRPSHEHAATRRDPVLGAGPRATDREEALRAGAPPRAEAGAHPALHGTFPSRSRLSCMHTLDATARAKSQRTTAAGLPI